MNGAARHELGEGFDFSQWHRLTAAAVAEGERRLAEARKAVQDASAAIRARERELRVLRKALALLPPPTAAVRRAPPPPAPGRGTRTGEGVGGRASVFLLEVMQQREDGQLTPRLAGLVGKGWADGTIQDGFKRLVADGLAEQPERGVYRLTEAGRSAPPPEPGTLPLTEPRREAAEAQEAAG